MWRATLEYVKWIELRDTSAHAVPDAHCVTALWRITFMIRKVLISVSEWPWQRDPFTVGQNFHGETPSHKTYTCQKKSFGTAVVYAVRSSIETSLCGAYLYATDGTMTYLILVLHSSELQWWIYFPHKRYWRWMDVHKYADMWKSKSVNVLHCVWWQLAYHSRRQGGGSRRHDNICKQKIAMQDALVSTLTAPLPLPIFFHSLVSAR